MIFVVVRVSGGGGENRDGEGRSNSRGGGGIADDEDGLNGLRLDRLYPF